MTTASRLVTEPGAPNPATSATIAQTLHAGAARLRAAGIEDAQIEAELLLRQALGLSRERLYTNLREPFSAASAIVYDTLLTRRAVHEPTPYITGHREFYGLEFACTPAALIPRQETELLVETAIDWLRSRRTGDSPTLAADIGTGGGAIAVSLAVRVPSLRLVATDTSADALDLARHNADSHQVADRITFVDSDLLAKLNDALDLIVANLPYIPSQTYAELAPEIREHEPQVALDAGPRGTELIEALLAQASERMPGGGLLLAEHAWDQGQALRSAANAAFPDARIETLRDLAGHERVISVQT